MSGAGQFMSRASTVVVTSSDVLIVCDLQNFRQPLEAIVSGE
jgi:hypothetical protein